MCPLCHVTLTGFACSVTVTIFSDWHRKDRHNISTRHRNDTDMYYS